MADAALANTGAVPARPAGWQGIAADWSSDQRAFKNVSWGKAMMWIFLLSDTFIFSCFLLSYMTVRISETVPWPNPSEVFALTIGGTSIPLILIAIMTFPQETFLNARWSEDQSAAMPCQPAGRARASPVLVSAGSAICS